MYKNGKMSVNFFYEATNKNKNYKFDITQSTY